MSHADSVVWFYVTSQVPFAIGFFFLCSAFKFLHRWRSWKVLTKIFAPVSQGLASRFSIEVIFKCRKLINWAAPLIVGGADRGVLRRRVACAKGLKICFHFLAGGTGKSRVICFPGPGIWYIIPLCIILLRRSFGFSRVCRRLAVWLCC